MRLSRLAEQERLQREQSGEEKLEDTNENSDSNENTIDIETDGTQGPSTSWFWNQGLVAATVTFETLVLLL